MVPDRIESVFASPAIPAILVSWLSVFRPCFTTPVWSQVLVLVTGTILAPGKRSVTQALRVMGLAERTGFGRYHEALNRARWDARDVSRRLLLHILAVLWPNGEVVIAIDDTIERRWGSKIKARGIYRDPVRTTKGQFVKTSGLRWLSLAVVLPAPFAGRRWALPFLTVLAPSARWSEAQGRRHKTLTDRGAKRTDATQSGQPAQARQAILQSKRWLADRAVVVVVADSGFSALDFIAAVRRHVCLITRLRLDASLYEPAPTRRPKQKGRPRLKGKALPKLSAVIADRKTAWTQITMAEWYGGHTRMLDYVSGTAIWYSSGMHAQRSLAPTGPRPRTSPTEWQAVSRSSMRAVASFEPGSSTRVMIRARTRSRRRSPPRCGRSSRRPTRTWPVRQGAADFEAGVAGGEEGVAAEGGAEHLDPVWGQVGEVGEGAGLDLARLAVALAEQMDRGRAPVGNSGDIHVERDGRGRRVWRGLEHTEERSDRWAQCSKGYHPALCVVV